MTCIPGGAVISGSICGAKAWLPSPWISIGAGANAGVGRTEFPPYASCPSTCGSFEATGKRDDDAAFWSVIICGPLAPVVNTALITCRTAQSVIQPDPLD